MILSEHSSRWGSSNGKTFSGLGLADHLIKRIPSPESEFASPAAGSPSQPTVATTAPEVEVVSPQVPVAAAPVDPSRFSKHVGKIVASLALIGVIGGDGAFRTNCCFRFSGNDNGASSSTGQSLWIKVWKVSLE